MNLRAIGSIGIIALVTQLVPAHAAPRDEVLEALGKCAVIADNGERLACYDALSPRVKDALLTPPKEMDRPPTKEEQESWFGFDLGSLFGGSGGESGTGATKPEDFGKERTPEVQAAKEAMEEEVSSITSEVTEISYTPSGRFIVFLKNGQVWRQIQGDGDKPHFKHNVEDNSVTVSRGMIGSYNMSINGGSHVYKVTRVK